MIHKGSMGRPNWAQFYRNTKFKKKKKGKLNCGCWDSSPGLHGHNVEFLPLNYSHWLLDINRISTKTSIKKFTWASHTHINSV